MSIANPVFARKPLALALLAAMSGLVSAPSHAADSKDPPTNHPEGLRAYYVRYATASSSAAEARAAVESQVSAKGGEVSYRLDRQHTLAVLLPTDAAQQMAQSADIELIEPVPQHRTMGQVVPWNVDQFQARDIWDRNRDGQVDAGAPDGSGIKVCIIDTGFYAAHDDFQGIVATGVSQITGENWTEDGAGHGSHVAGTVNAMNNNIGVVGVLPGRAKLHIVKVFSNAGDWVDGQSDLAAAAIACKDAGANVISMSLGGPAAATEEAVFQDLYDNFGILNVAAAGNDGDATRSYPANYDSVVSVAALDRTELAADFTQYPSTSYNPANPPANVEWDTTELAGGGVDVLSTWPGPPHGNVPNYALQAGATTYSANHIEGAGNGTQTGALVNGGLCTTGTQQPSWNGAIVLCARGTVAFSEKVNTAGAGGAKAVLIYNNAAGSLNATCVNDSGTNLCTTTIPAMTLTQADGEALVASSIGTSVTAIADDGNCGGTCSGGYNTISGTSMATPGVAAGMGFVWNACGGPAGITNKQLRQLLRDSAKDLTGTQPVTNVVYGAGYDPVTGFGLVQLRDALDLGNQRFGSTCAIGLAIDPANVEVCGATTSSSAFNITLGDAFTGTANLSVAGLPSGATGAFTGNPVVHPSKTASYALNGLNNVASGLYALQFEAVDAGNASNTAGASVNVSVFANAPGAIGLAAPTNGATDQPNRPTLSWNGNTDAGSYTLEVSTSPTFDTILYSKSQAGTSHQLPNGTLQASTTYYWRVRASNVCGNGGNSPVYSFRTATTYCATPAAAIPDNNAAGVTSTITVPTGGSLTDLDVKFYAHHTWIGDLSATLTKGATTITLIDRPGRTTSGVGCSGSDPQIILDDEAATAAETSCTTADPGYPIGTRLRPNSPLTAADGTDFAGTWTLKVVDTGASDTGTLDEWCLQPTLAAGANTAPVAANDTGTTARNVALTVAAPGVLGNDTDAESNPLTAVAVAQPAHGTLALNANGGYTYTPATDYCGADGFTYKANDGTADSANATVALTVTCTNRAPVATNDSYATDRNAALTIAAPGLLANDTDADANALTAVIAGQPAHGTLALNANGGFTYTPATDYCGADSFTYKANDGTVDSANATAAITVNCTNRAPAAANDTYATARNAALTIAAPGLLGNDSDADGNSLTAVVASQPAHGTLALNANGGFTYTPATDYCGADSFTYKANDGTTASAAATASINVTCTNRAPVAANDSYPTKRNVALTVAAPGLLGNDTDADGNALTAAIVGQPGHGTLALNANGSFTYTPSTDYCGADSFTYKANDGSTDSANATVAIDVGCVNRAPTVIKPIVPMTLRETLPVAVNAAEAFGDADGDKLTYSMSGAPASLTIDADSGMIRGTLAMGDAKPWTITITATDTGGMAAQASFTMTVTTFTPGIFAGGFEGN